MNTIPEDLTPVMPTLADVLMQVARAELQPTRRRDLLSAIRRSAKLLGKLPAEIPLDMRSIADRWKNLTPAAIGVTPKTLRTLRSNLLAAIEASGLKPVLRTARLPASQAWQALLADEEPRIRAALFPLGKFASSHGIEPAAVTTEVILAFIECLRSRTLKRAPGRIHRRVAIYWCEVAARHRWPPVEVPNTRKPPRRVQPDVMAPELQADIEHWRSFMRSSNPLDAASREKALAPRTIGLRVNQLLSAITAYRDAGHDVSSLTTLREIVQPETVRVILGRMYEAAGRQTTAYTEGTAKTLVAIAREHVRLSDTELATLKAIVRKLPKRQSGMVEKNRVLLARFNDPDLVARMYDLPDRIWSAVDLKQPNTRTLLSAQLAIALGLLQYAPVRMENLIALRLGEHLHMAEKAGQPAIILFAGSEVKNHEDLTYEIPAELADRPHSRQAGDDRPVCGAVCRVEVGNRRT